MLSFQIYDTRIRLSIWFFTVLYLFLIMDTHRLYPILFGSIFLHETGHLLMMKFFKKKISQISFMPFGIHIRCDDTVQQSYGREFLITLAGPISNLACAIGCWIFTEYYSTNISLLFLIIIVNLILGIFHLLPIGVLDGGRLLTQILQMRGVEQTEKICATISFIFLLPLLLLSVWLFLTQGCNPTLLITGIYLTVTAVYQLKS